MSLYLDNGFLNVKWLDREANRINAAFVIILGSRQIGKTFGTLKLMTDERRNFILMRRTKTESDFITNGTVNPFIPLGRTDISVKKDTEYTGKIVLTEDDKNIPLGITTSLTCISKIRGFSGKIFTDLVYDEFIPEAHVNRIKNEGDAFLNAVVTIAGNRELEGLPPLRCWLLANTNNIASPILEALNITDKIERMENSGKELSIMPERGIIIVLARGEAVIERRRNTSLLRAIGRESQFSEMAFDNKFSYNDSENVTRRDLKQFNPVCSVTGVLTIWKHKSTEELFISSYRRTAKEYSNTDRGRKQLLIAVPYLKLAYVYNRTAFETLALKEKFKTIIQV